MTRLRDQVQPNGICSLAGSLIEHYAGTPEESGHLGPRHHQREATAHCPGIVPGIGKWSRRWIEAGCSRLFQGAASAAVRRAVG